MKKLFIPLFILSMFFMACEEPYCADEEAIAEYEKIPGMTFEQTTAWYGGSDEAHYNEDFPMEIKFADDSITVDGTTYAFSKTKDISWDKWHDHIAISVGGKRFAVDLYTYTSYGELVYKLTLSDPDADEHNCAFYYPAKEEVPSGGDDDDDEQPASSVNGTYTFNTAVAPQMNGAITLTNGTWTYSGDKSSPAASSGTYTVAGGKVTVKWTASGYETSETFTVSTSGSTSTWESDNAYTSTFLSMLFGVSATELTFVKS